MPGDLRSHVSPLGPPRAVCLPIGNETRIIAPLVQRLISLATLLPTQPIFSSSRSALATSFPKPRGSRAAGVTMTDAVALHMPPTSSAEATRADRMTDLPTLEDLDPVET